jgi:hypothetical protein
MCFSPLRRKKSKLEGEEKNITNQNRVAGGTYLNYEQNDMINLVAACPRFPQIRSRHRQTIGEEIVYFLH